MHSLWPQLAAWLERGEPFALATVTAVSGSAPRAPGSCMAIMPETSRFIGSVSSGCLDVEVVEAARAALRTGETEHLRFGPDGNPPWTDGLTCGGWIAVRVEPWWGSHPRAEVRAIAAQVRDWLENDQPGAIVSSDTHHVTISSEEDPVGDTSAFPASVLDRARGRLRDELPPVELSAQPSHDPAAVFIRTIRRRPRLLIVGGVDVTVHLVALAREIGFTTTVIDPRAAFVATERFVAQPDELVRGWPQERIGRANLGPRDAALVLTHDPKIDDVALLALLATKVGYVGALGSTRSHASRLERLREQGAGKSALARIQGPAGIHLGTPDAAGIALGIMAGIARWQAAREREAVSL
jgi:xanthine dehydrogenase accessory factor